MLPDGEPSFSALGRLKLMRPPGVIFEPDSKDTIAHARWPEPKVRLLDTDAFQYPQKNAALHVMSRPAARQDLITCLQQHNVVYSATSPLIAKLIYGLKIMFMYVVTDSSHSDSSSHCFL